MRLAQVKLSRESGDSVLNSDVLATCTSTTNVLLARIGQFPPLGEKPFVVRQAEDNIPRADLRGLPAEYWINVTCLHSRDYNQLAFQIGHEAGHYFVNPYRSNWFIESICTALSLIGLTEMAQAWAITPPFPNWTGYACQFQEYRKEAILDALKKVGLPSILDVPKWISQQLPTVISNKNFSRDHEMLVAARIEELVSKHPTGIAAICQLGDATCPQNQTSWTDWLSRTSGDQLLLVQKITSEFQVLPFP